jgi:hypothetical protein
MPAFGDVAAGCRGGNASAGLLEPERWARKRLAEAGITRLDPGRPVIAEGPHEGKITPAGWITAPTRELADVTYWGRTVREAYENAREGRGTPLTAVLKERR